MWMEPCAPPPRLLQDAAADPACAPLPDTTTVPASINFTCADLDCVAYMRGMVETLPDCHCSVATNEMTALSRALSQCNVCSDAQTNQGIELYKAAVANPACADTMSVVDDLVAISADWGCGTLCQPVLKELIDHQPPGLHRHLRRRPEG